ncbi:MAG: helix-turn-helix domain-containing protein [Nanoarchaeota archaeon]
MYEILQKIGLTEAESRVYISLFDLKNSTIGPLAKKSNVSYSKIQILLDKLIEKGLASYIIKNKVKYFSPTNPSKIFDYLERKRIDIEQQEKEAKTIIDALVNKLYSFREEEQVEILEGYEGLKSAYDEGLSLLNKGDEILVLGASHGIYTDSTKYKTFFERINLIRKEKGLKYRVIYNENIKTQKNIGLWENQKDLQVRFLMQQTPASINIQGERTMIIYWSKDKPKVFLIRSKIVTDSFRIYFEEIWKVAKK